MTTEEGVSRALLERLDKLRQLKADAEAELKDITAELTAIQEVLVPQFMAAGMQSQKLADGRTFYLRKEEWAYPKSVENGGGRGSAGVLEALVASGLGDMVHETYNTQTLSAYVREKERAGEELPAPLVEAIDVVVKTEIRVRRS